MFAVVGLAILQSADNPYDAWSDFRDMWQRGDWQTIFG
jgi:hypothetical protein